MISLPPAIVRLRAMADNVASVESVFLRDVADTLNVLAVERDLILTTLSGLAQYIEARNIRDGRGSTPHRTLSVIRRVVVIMEENNDTRAG